MRKATIVGKHADNGQTIYKARIRKGMSQKVLGAAAGIGYQQIIRLENGENLPSGATRDRLAKALGLAKQEILSADDPPSAVVMAEAPFRPRPRRGAPRARRESQDGIDKVSEAA